MNRPIQMSLVPRNDVVISECGKYRYVLRRLLAANLGRNDGQLTIIMLNPSTADADTDDQTVRRCVRFARDNYNGLLSIVNLFAFRARNPIDLRAHPMNIIGPDNENWLRQECSKAFTVIVAWGNHGSFLGRDKQVLSMLQGMRIRTYCFGVTQKGQPMHPLYASLYRLREY